MFSRKVFDVLGAGWELFRCDVGIVKSFKMMKRYLIAFCLAFGCFVGAAEAQTKLNVHGAGRLYPVAVPQLCLKQGNSSAVTEIPQAIAKDLQLSGYFDVMNPNAYIETPGKCDGPDGLAYSDWSVIGVEGLVRGVVEENGGNVRVSMFLHDVQIQRVVLGKEYTGDASHVRDIAHKFSNEILKFFTGEEGVFGSQIVFSSRVGRFKELFIMDMDGSNLRQLTNDRGLAISASWNPNGRELIYTSYRDRIPEIYTMDLASRRFQRITRGAPLELGATFTPPDARNFVVSRSVGRESDLVMMDRGGTILRKLTSGGGIDVSPDYSPDGRQIVFCSDRAGGPQIYVMNSDGSNARRISYVTSSYCTSPSWSPKGDKIAFVCRADGGFQIFVADPSGMNALQLTSYGDNEDPDWSPDGRYIVFASTFGRRGNFSLAMMRNDGANITQISTTRGSDTEPAWGPVPR